MKCMTLSDDVTSGIEDLMAMTAAATYMFTVGGWAERVAGGLDKGGMLEA